MVEINPIEQMKVLSYYKEDSNLKSIAEAKEILGTLEEEYYAMLTEEIIEDKTEKTSYEKEKFFSQTKDYLY